MRTTHLAQPLLRHLILPIGICHLALVAGSASAADPKPKKSGGKTPVAVVELTPAGKTLESKYAALQQTLKQEIEKQLPKIDPAKVAAWKQTSKAEADLEKEADSKASAVVKLEKTEKALKQLEESAKLPPQTYAQAKSELQEILAKGESDPKLAALLESEEKFQASIKKERDQLNLKIEKARTAAQEAKAMLPEAIKAAAAAKEAHQKALKANWAAMDALGTGATLASSQLDGKLAQYTVITEATPRGLAEFAQKAPEHEKLIEQLLADKDLMLQMLVADGPNSGKYGEAMKIYTDIQKASPKAKEGLFQRMALAVSLGHSVPIPERSAASGGDGDDSSESADANGQQVVKTIDPVKRYLSYEKWYLDGELDKGFKDLSVWNLAMALDGRDPDEAFAWGRQMLRNFRPDCIPDNGDTSVYVDVVNKEIQYSSKDIKNDRPELQFMQNILANGGICGRRAFFGRFILRAFGIPTTARKQPGHATLAHWHPDGWQTQLGGDWGLGARGNYSSMNRTRSSQYGADVNFQASSLAREDATAFLKVKRAQWIGALVGEEPKLGFIRFTGGSSKKNSTENDDSPFWHELALHEQKRIVSELDAKKAQPLASAVVTTKEPAATGKVSVDDKGIITIPSAACSSPTESVRAPYHGTFKDLIVFVKAKNGETHLHVSRYSTEADSFEYTFDAPKAGKYQLVASVVTASPNRQLVVSANGGATVEMPLPYTIGMWDNTAPIELELKAGTNVLKFQGPSRVTIGKFTLTPK